jgi:hypothetical protein
MTVRQLDPNVETIPTDGKTGKRFLVERIVKPDDPFRLDNLVRLCR